MRNNKGMSMISLVLAMIIMVLLSAITVDVGVQAYNSIRVQNFISQLKVIQGKVDQVSEEEIDFSAFVKLTDIKNADIETYTKFESIITNPREYNIDTNYSWDDSSDYDLKNYYYFTPESLESKLGLKDQSLHVIINFETRNVIAKKGVNRDGIYYYRQYDLPGGNQLIK